MESSLTIFAGSPCFILLGKLLVFFLSLFCNSFLDTFCNKFNQSKLYKDPCSMAKKCCRSQWAPKERVEQELAPLWKARGSLTIGDNLLLYNGRIVVPHSMWKETMEKIHEGHQGIERCQARVKASVWWPGINHHISQMVQQCKTCCKTARPRKEPLQATPLPDYSFQTVGTDLFELKSVHYLLTVDYFSRYPEVTKLASTTSSSIITALKAVFSRHGIPEVVRSDNGP